MKIKFSSDDQSVFHEHYRDWIKSQKEPNEILRFWVLPGLEDPDSAGLVTTRHPLPLEFLEFLDAKGFPYTR
jgi:hypothetical protein